MRMMKAQTLKEKILAKTIATAAATTMMLKKALDARNLLQRSISLVKIVEKLTH
jgi:sulfur transfer complex TusBCD TusB component (DsrH family)